MNQPVPIITNTYYVPTTGLGLVITLVCVILAIAVTVGGIIWLAVVERKRERERRPR